MITIYDILENINYEIEAMRIHETKNLIRKAKQIKKDNLREFLEFRNIDLYDGIQAEERLKLLENIKPYKDDLKQTKLTEIL